MPTDDRRWTDADRDTVAEALRQHHIVLDPDDRAREHDACACGLIVEDWDEHWSEVALDAAAPLIAARTRAQVAEQIAQAIEAMYTRHPLLDRTTAAAIARAHATTEEDTDAAA